jgi:hypothetical protein
MKILLRVSVAACLAVVFSAATLAPASARHLKRHHHVRMVAQVPPSNASREPDPYGVYFGGYKVSRDPDPNVRQELLRDYWAIYRW